MRTTLNLDEDVYQAAMTLAEGSGKALGKVVSELARRGLRPGAEHAAADSLPVFSVPSQAELIPGNRAGELLAEDAHLFALARVRGLRLVTFDRKTERFNPFADTVEVLAV